ncbi:MAG: HIT family protein [Ilumatobacteraceae bacterium]
MLERLWNGWRAQYVQRDTKSQPTPQSVFTQILNSGLPDDETHIVHRGLLCFVILNAFPYSPGHLLVLPYREVGDLELLTAEETVEIWATVTMGVRVLKDEYHPHGINIGINLGQVAGGSIAQHLHIHIVPRWGGDTNFMVSVASTKILPEALDVTSQRIRTAWSRLES